MSHNPDFHPPRRPSPTGKGGLRPLDFRRLIDAARPARSPAKRINQSIRASSNSLLDNGPRTLGPHLQLVEPGTLRRPGRTWSRRIEPFSPRRRREIISSPWNDVEWVRLASGDEASFQGEHPLDELAAPVGTIAIDPAGPPLRIATCESPLGVASRSASHRDFASLRGGGGDPNHAVPSGLRPRCLTSRNSAAGAAS